LGPKHSSKYNDHSPRSPDLDPESLPTPRPMPPGSRIGCNGSTRSLPTATGGRSVARRSWVGSRPHENRWPSVRPRSTGSGLSWTSQGPSTLRVRSAQISEASNPEPADPAKALSTPAVVEMGPDPEWLATGVDGAKRGGASGPTGRRSRLRRGREGPSHRPSRCRCVRRAGLE